MKTCPTQGPMRSRCSHNNPRPHQGTNVKAASHHHSLGLSPKRLVGPSRVTHQDGLFQPKLAEASQITYCVATELREQKENEKNSGDCLDLTLAFCSFGSLVRCFSRCACCLECCSACLVPLLSCGCVVCVCLHIVACQWLALPVLVSPASCLWPCLSPFLRLPLLLGVPVNMFLGLDDDARVKWVESVTSVDWWVEGPSSSPHHDVLFCVRGHGTRTPRGLR